MKNVKIYENAVETYKSFKKTLNEDFLNKVVKEVGEEFGDFACVFRGQTPSFNDGEPCTHSSDYFVADLKPHWRTDEEYFDYEDYGCDEFSNWLEVDEENKTSINTPILKNEDFQNALSVLDELTSDIYHTNYDVKIKYKLGVVYIEHEEYYPDY